MHEKEHKKKIKLYESRSVQPKFSKIIATNDKMLFWKKNIPFCLNKEKHITTICRKANRKLNADKKDEY